MPMILSPDGVRLNVAEGGNPHGPPVLFLHGFSQSLDAWEPQFTSPSLEAFRLVRVDLRGHGDSDKPEDSAAYTESARWADDVAAIMSALNLRNVVLVGWSYGGYIIADYLRTYGSGNVAGIVLAGGATKRGVPAAKPFSDRELMPIWTALFSDVPDELAGGIRDFVRRCTAESQPAERYEAALAANHRTPSYVRRALMMRQLENDDVLAAIGRPVLIVHGDRDAIVLPAAAEHHASTIPGSTLLWYEGVGHTPFVEAPDRFNADLAAFASAASAEAGTVFP